jgi:hypothetical protein
MGCSAMSTRMLLYRVVLMFISRGAARLVVRGEHYRRVSCWSDVDCTYLSRVANSLSVDIFVCTRDAIQKRLDMFNDVVNRMNSCWNGWGLTQATSRGPSDGALAVEAEALRSSITFTIALTSLCTHEPSQSWGQCCAF